MSAFTDKLQLEYGWNPGEDGWGGGMDANIQKIDAAIKVLDEDVEAVQATAMTEEERAKLISIEKNANFYEHPLSHLARMIQFDDGESLQLKLERGTLNDNTEEARSLSQIEREVMNIALYLEAMKMYPDYNALMAENFDTLDEVDQFSCAVKSIMAGDKAIDVESVQGLLCGAWYTISDGISQEYVQIQSVAKNSTVNRIILTSPVQNTYQLSSTYLYRTTAQIKDKKAEGAGEKRWATWDAGLSWSGIIGDAEVTAMMPETNIDNAASFTIDGDITYTVDGEITLNTD